MSNKYISINIKADKTSWAIINDEFVIEQSSIKENNHINISGEKMIAEINDLINYLQKQHGKIDAAIIILPGGIDSEENILISGSRWLSFKQRTNLKEVFGEHIKKELYFINDANASVMGSLVTGEFENHKSIVYLISNTGVGTGVMMNGVCLKGQNSTLGEIGKLEMQGTTIEANLSYNTLLSKAFLITGEEIETLDEMINLAKDDQRVEDLLANWKKALIKTLASINYIYDPSLIKIESAILSYDYFKDWDIEDELKNFAINRNSTKKIEVLFPEEIEKLPLLGAVWSYKNK